MAAFCNSRLGTWVNISCFFFYISNRWHGHKPFAAASHNQLQTQAYTFLGATTTTIVAATVNRKRRLLRASITAPESYKRNCENHRTKKKIKKKIKINNGNIKKPWIIQPRYSKKEMAFSILFFLGITVPLPRFQGQLIMAMCHIRNKKKKKYH